MADKPMSNSTSPPVDVTIEGIMAASEAIRHLDKLALFRSNREAARQDDVNNNRGYLILNPELKVLGGITVYSFHGLVIERDGVEYRVIVDEKVRGTRVKDSDGNDTEEIAGGWWLAPLPAFDALGVPPEFRMPRTLHGDLKAPIRYGKCVRCGSPKPSLSAPIECAACVKKREVEGICFHGVKIDGSGMPCSSCFLMDAIGGKKGVCFHGVKIDSPQGCGRCFMEKIIGKEKEDEDMTAQFFNKLFVVNLDGAVKKVIEATHTLISDQIKENRMPCKVEDVLFNKVANKISLTFTLRGPSKKVTHTKTWDEEDFLGSDEPVTSHIVVELLLANVALAKL